jgi:hypothetical protein
MKNSGDEALKSSFWRQTDTSIQIEEYCTTLVWLVMAIGLTVLSIPAWEIMPFVLKVLLVVMDILACFANVKRKLLFCESRGQIIETSFPVFGFGASKSRTWRFDEVIGIDALRAVSSSNKPKYQLVLNTVSGRIVMVNILFGSDLAPFWSDIAETLRGVINSGREPGNQLLKTDIIGQTAKNAYRRRLRGSISFDGNGEANNRWH